MQIIKQMCERQLLATQNGKFYVISQSRPEFDQITGDGPEVLIFPSDERGVVTEFVEAGGCRGCTLKEFLERGPIKVYDD